MRPGFAGRLAAVRWADFKTAYGNAADRHHFEYASGKPADRWGTIAEQLLALVSDDPAKAMAASHHLWCCLCHQHAYVSSAALPALPFLVEALADASPALKIEILDILVGFVECSRGAAEPWIRDLWDLLVAERPTFERIALHEQQDVARWGQRILQALDPESSDQAQR
jgi:hypothetical protein